MTEEKFKKPKIVFKKTLALAAVRHRKKKMRETREPGFSDFHDYVDMEELVGPAFPFERDEVCPQ